MKQGIVRKVVLGGILIGSLSALAGCGSDSGIVAPTGRVVKGPVVGAKVYDKNGNFFATTDATGAFSMTRQGPYSTTDGIYVPLDQNGNALAPVAAPPMKAPEGYAQITPLSTIVASAPPAQQAQVEHELQVVLSKMGITDIKTADLSVKTSGNASAIVFAESVGAVLATAANTSGSADAKTAINDAVTSALISTVTTMATTAATSATPPSVAAIASAISTSVTAAINSAVASDPTTFATVNVTTLTNTMTSATTTAAQGAASLPENQPLPAPPSETTGSTGGTGGTGGIK